VVLLRDYPITISFQLVSESIGFIQLSYQLVMEKMEIESEKFL